MENTKMLTAGKAAEICKGILLSGNKETILEDFVKDTRELKKGDMYVGLKGEKFNGNTLWEEAIKLGAIGVLIEEVEIDRELLKKYKDKVIIKVKNTLKAIQELATYKRQQYDIPVIAVTGSVGKTSTKDIIASVLKQKYDVHKNTGNYNNHIGLPLTILGLKENHTALITEMGMNHFGEIQTLTNIAKPTLAVITNIGTAHIGNLGSRENILKAKLEILEGLEKNGCVVINNDNDLLHAWKESKPNYTIKTYGIENNSDYMAKDINCVQGENTYSVEIENKTYNVKVPIGGSHFVYNSLCAICVGRHYQIPMEKILKGIEHIDLTKRRMEIIKKEYYTIINDSYNANYDSMKPAIEYLHKVDGNRKIAVLGDMLELGEYTKELHEKVGEEVVKNKIDKLIIVGEYAKNIVKRAKELGMAQNNIIECEDTYKATEELRRCLKKGDVVLLKASNAMKFNIILENL